MDSMFWNAYNFNNGGEPLDWENTVNVENMSSMFCLASSFNQKISGWDVSSVTIMDEMFYDADSFNQDISEWNEHIAEDIRHTDFSIGCPIETAYHPYPSWD